MPLYETIFDRSLRACFFQRHSTGAFPAHLHHHIEICFVRSGEYPITVGGISKTLKPGELAYISPYQIHSNTQNHAQIYILGIHPAYLPSGYRTPAFTAPFFSLEQMTPGFEGAVEYAFSVAQSDNNFRQEILLAQISAITGDILAHMEQSPGPDTGCEQTQTLQRVIAYCNLHLTRDLSLDEISLQLGLNKFYLSKLVSNKLGMPLSDYIRSQRIALACDRIAHSQDSITDIYTACGFQNQSTFNRAFKTFTGYTPNEYRRDYSGIALTHSKSDA